MMDAFERRLQHKARMNQPIPRTADDPRNISKNVASVPRPPTDEIIAKQKSRFPKNTLHD